MSTTNGQPTGRGMLSTAGTAKPFLAKLLDLYNGDLAFRGITDFAAIGAVVMLFLHPPLTMAMPWNGGGGGGGSGGTTTGGGGATVQGGGSTSSSGQTAPGLPLPIIYPQWLINPSLAGPGFDPDEAAFATSSVADQPRLKAARHAFANNQYLNIPELLREADGSDRNVAFMRAIGFVTKNTADDNRAAIAQLRLAADKGHRTAGGVLGWLLRTDRPGVTTSKDEGQRLIEAAAAAGDRQGQRLASIAYINGEFGRLDPPKARDLARKAADSGDTIAMMLYSRLTAEGIGGPANGREAESYLRKAATTGLTEAQVVLGNWLVAQYKAALLADPKEAVDWLTRAYEKGHSLVALVGLTYFHEAVAKSPPWADLKRAFDFAQRCSGFRDAVCQFNMGVLLNTGKGTPPDAVRARAHIETAKQLNHPNAAAFLAQIDARLTPQQRQAATAYETVLKAALRPIPSPIHFQYEGAPAVPPPVARAPDQPGATGAAAANQPNQGSGNLASGNLTSGNQTSATNGPSGLSGPDLLQCRNEPAAADARMLACTRVIQAGTYAPTEVADAYYQRGTLHSDAGRFNEAYGDLDEAFKRAPANGTYAIDRARSQLMRNNNAQAAFDEYEIGLKLKPGSAAGLAGRAEAHRRLGRPDLALADANKAGAIDPRMAYAYEVRARAYKDKKDWAGVVREATAGIGIEPGNTTLLFMRADAYDDQKELRLALSDLDDLIRRGSKNADVYNLRGYVRRKMGAVEWDAAIEDFTVAISLTNHGAAPHFNKAQIYFDRRQHGQAIAELDQAIDQHKSTTTSYLLLRGRTHLAMQNTDRAEADFDRIIGLEPAEGVGYYWRGVARAAAIGSLLERCEQESKRARASDLTGGPCARPVDYLPALKDFEAARAFNVPDAPYQAGLLLRKARRPEQAIAAFETARKMNPMSSNALVQIGVIQLDDFKNERAALEKFNEAIVLDPGNGLAYANRANILSRYARSKSEAIRDFRKALEIDRDDDYAKNGLRKLGIAP